jgi:hypothetical protein
VGIFSINRVRLVLIGTRNASFLLLAVGTIVGKFSWWELDFYGDGDF